MGEGGWGVMMKIGRFGSSIGTALLSMLVSFCFWELDAAYSMTNAVAQVADNHAATPLLQVPPINAEGLRQRDKQAKASRREMMLKFAEPFEANASHIDHGQCDVLPDGRMRWTLMVHAPGATDIKCRI